MSPWKTLPAHAADAQVFAIGDVHGQADTLAATLDAIASVPRSHLVRRLIFLGDLIDRGPQSLAAISLYKSAADLAMECQIIQNFGHTRENFRKLDVQMCRAENKILVF